MTGKQLDNAELKRLVEAYVGVKAKQKVKSMGDELFWIRNGIIAVVLFAAIAMSINIVNEGFVGVQKEWGKAHTVQSPGIYLLVPFKDSIEAMSVQIQKYETSASAASKDLQVVNTNLAVNYRLAANDEGLLTLYRDFRNMHEERIIQPFVQEVVKASTAKHDAVELITDREQVKQEITTSLKNKLQPYGITVSDVSITNFEFSDDFDAAIEQKVVANQKLEKEKIDLETKKIEVQRQIAVAEAEAKVKVIDANATAEARLTVAEAEAAAIAMITQTITDPYIKYQYVDAWDGELPQVLGQNGIIVSLEDEPEEFTTIAVSELAWYNNTGN